MNIDNDTWQVINSYFDDTPNYLSKHHIDSFNDFILNRIPATFKIPFLNPQKIFVKDKKNPRIEYEMHVYYGGKDGKGIYMSKPTIYDSLTQEMKPMFPNECRLKNLTYAAHLFVDIEIEYTMKQDDKVIYENVPHPVPEILKARKFGRIPIMLRSKPCVLFNQDQETLKQMGESRYEHGGYFIVDGMEKVIISQERKAENKLYILKSKEELYDYSAHVKSIPKESFLYPKTTYVSMLSRNKAIVVTATYLKKGNKSFDIPLFIFFRALGIESDEEIMKYILHDLDNQKANYFMELLRPSMEEAEMLGVYDQLSALTFLEKYPDKVADELERGGGDIKRNKVQRLSFLYDAIYKSLFPHVGDNFVKKAYYLGYIVNELLQVATGLKPQTDRDSWRYKRVDLSGFLLANLFREKVMKLSWHIRTQVETKYEFGHTEFSGDNFIHILNETNANEFFDFTIIETGFKDAFKMGEITKKKGLIQSVQRLSNYWIISYLRRINTPNDLGGRIPFEQRMTHNTQYGIFCLSEYPYSGETAGLKKHLTVVSHVTFGSNSQKLEKFLKKMGMINVVDLHPGQMAGKTKIFVNGDWIGVHEEPEKLVKLLRNMRRNGLINVYTSIAWRIEDMEIHCYTDGGRVCFPVYVVENNRLLLTPEHVEGIRSGKYGWLNMISGFKNKKTKFDYFQDFLEPGEEGFDVKNLESDLVKYRGVVEYLDTEEIDTCLLSPSMNIPTHTMKRFTHCELHPALIFGVMGSTIPFPHYSQAPRNVYASAQNKQSVAYYADNYRNRMETTNLLYNAQRPLLGTRMRKYITTDDLPSGHNVIVAIACYGGFNQEDSLIINWSSLQRGMFLSTYYKTYQKSELEDVKRGTEEVFYNPTKVDPDEEEGLKTSRKYQGYSFDHLDEFGFIKEGTYLTGKEILMGAYSRIKNRDGRQEAVNASVPTKSKDAIVDKVFTCYTNNKRNRMCKVRTAQERVPEFGDKFASRNGQKGTVGMRFLAEDMPFTQSGISPDIIVNPHAIPSRMTIGQLIESIYCKACVDLGFLGDATAFNYVDKENLSDILEQVCGFERQGDEILYNGQTGEQFKCTIFIGPTYYQRLKHMVRDKINTRSSGSRYGPFNIPSQGGGYSARERQPPGGRALEGGLRIGEMERDCVLAHGMQVFTKESMMERSDKFSCYVCNTSGRLSVGNQFDRIYYSPDVDGPTTFHINESIGTDNSQQNNDPNLYHKMVGLNVLQQKAMSFSQVQVPYTFKLLVQELESIGISMRLISEDNVNNFNQLPVDSKLLEFNSDVDNLKIGKPSISMESLTDEDSDLEEISKKSENSQTPEDTDEDTEDDADGDNDDDAKNKDTKDGKEDTKNDKKEESKDKSDKKESKENKTESKGGKEESKEGTEEDKEDREDKEEDTEANEDSKEDSNKDTEEETKDEGKSLAAISEELKPEEEKEAKVEIKAGDKVDMAGGVRRLETEPSLDKFVPRTGGGFAPTLDNLVYKPPAPAQQMMEEISGLEEYVPPLGQPSDTLPSMNNMVSMSNKVLQQVRLPKAPANNLAGGGLDSDVKIVKLSGGHDMMRQEEPSSYSAGFDLNHVGGRRRRPQRQNRNQYGGFNVPDREGDEEILQEVFLG